MKIPKIVNHRYELIANAEKPDEICIVIPGTWEGHWSGGDYAITERDIDEMIANFNTEGRDLLFDYNHDSLWGDSKAAAWGKSLEKRDGKIYCKVEWTEEGKKAVESKEYRFLSNVLIFNYFDPNNKKLTGSYLHSVALTNVPFQKELPEIMNKMFPNIEKKEGGEMKDILAALGVANKEEALVKIKANKTLIANAATQTETVNTLTTNNEELTTEVKELKETIANNEVDMDIAKGELLPKNRETGITLKNTSKEAYDAFIKNTEKPPKDKIIVPNNGGGAGGKGDEEDFSDFLPNGGEEK